MVSPHLIFQNLNSLVVSLAQLVSPSVALLAELVNLVVSWEILGCFQAIVKLHSELVLPTELQLDRVGVDFVFPRHK